LCPGTNCDEKVRPALTAARLEPRILDMRLVAVPCIVVALLSASAAPARAQALGDVAKQEAERRKALGTPGKVYTNDNLRSEPQPAAVPGTSQNAASPAASAPAAPGGQAPAGQATATPAPADEAVPMAEDAWRKRITAARDALTRAQIFAEALQSRVNALTTDFVNRDDPAQRDTIGGERQKAMSELDRVKREIADHQKAITAIQDEARRAGVPAGWVR
jgi:hypothetical protein